MPIDHRVPSVRAAALALCAAAFASSASAQGAPLDIATLTASEAAQRLCAGSLSSEQLVAAYLAQAKAKPQLNAFITLDEAGALKAARAADAARRRGGPCKPLAGLPVVDQGQHPGPGPARHAPARPRSRASCRAPTRRWSPSCARPAPSCWARPTCTSWPSASAATTPPSRPGPTSACAMPTMRRASPAAPPRATARRWARAWRRPRWAPTPAARCAFPAPSTAAPRCVPPWAAIRSRASCRSRTRATRPGRWRSRWLTWRCSTASSPAARRWCRRTSSACGWACAKGFYANLDADTRARHRCGAGQAARRGRHAGRRRDAEAGRAQWRRRLPRRALRGPRRHGGLPAKYRAGVDIRAAGRGHRQPRRQGHLRRPGDPAQAAGGARRGRCQAGLRQRDAQGAAGAAEALSRHLQEEPARRAGLPHRAARGAGRHARVQQPRELRRA